MATEKQRPQDSDQTENRSDNPDRVIHSNTATTGMSSDPANSEGNQRQQGSVNKAGADANEGDTGQGAPGIQGQYAGNDDLEAAPGAGKSHAPDREDPDRMGQMGSSHLALGSRKGQGDHYAEDGDNKEEEEQKGEGGMHESNDSQ